MFDILFTLDGGLDVFVLLEVDQPLDAVFLREARHQPISMLVNATNERSLVTPTYRMPFCTLARM